MFVCSCMYVFAPWHPRITRKHKKTLSDKQSIISKYEKKVEAKTDKFNTITLIPGNGQREYILGLSRKSPEGARIEEQLLFEKEIDLNFWFFKNWLITTWPTIEKEYIQWLDTIQVAEKKKKN